MITVAQELENGTGGHTSDKPGLEKPFNDESDGSGRSFLEQKPSYLGGVRPNVSDLGTSHASRVFWE